MTDSVQGSAATETTCGDRMCREHCVHPRVNRQYNPGGLTFFCTRCCVVTYA